MLSRTTSKQERKCRDTPKAEGPKHSSIPTPTPTRWPHCLLLSRWLSYRNNTSPTALGYISISIHKQVDSRISTEKGFTCIFYFPHNMPVIFPTISQGLDFFPSRNWTDVSYVTLQGSQESDKERQVMTCRQKWVWMKYQTLTLIKPSGELPGDTLTSDMHVDTSEFAAVGLHTLTRGKSSG